MNYQKLLFIFAFFGASTFAQNCDRGNFLKYYVALFQAKKSAEYIDKIDIDFEQKYFFLLHETLIYDTDELYFVKKYSNKYLNYDVYFVFTTESHGDVFTAGIDKNNNIIKLAGFTEKRHIYEDKSEYKNFNDSLYVKNLGLFKKSKAKIDAFVLDTAILTKFITYPRNYILESNSYKIINSSILGRCVLIDKDNKEEYRWNYLIPDTGTIEFNKE